MSVLHDLSQEILSVLTEKGISSFSYILSESEKQELNTENTDFSLFRTVFNRQISITTLPDGRKGSASGNDLSSEGIRKVVSDAVAGAESALPDEANVIAEKETPEVFRSGSYDADMALFYTRLSELLESVRSDYPKIRILQLIADHTKSHSLYCSSTGTEFESYDGVYHVMLEFAANDGEMTTGINGAFVATNDLSSPLLSQGSLARHLADTEKSLNLTDIPGKFEGTVIFTPDCLENFVSMLIGNYLESSVILDGTSRWLDKLDEKVADEKITLRLLAADDRLAVRSPFTADGYKTQDVTLIENGVLKSHLLSLYAAKKTGRPVTRNSGSGLVMERGDTALADMIASVSKGLLLGGFSGGHPGANGEFSGVAKNSFYIENGKIAGAVSETMVNGNLEKVFRNVVAVSKEAVCDGTSVFPYMAADGIVISGK